MSDLEDWFRSAAANQATSPDGEPEGMQRSGVNDSARERAAAVKRWYDDPGFRKPFEDYTFTRVSNTQFRLADGSVESDASQLLSVGQYVRMIEGATTWLGFIVSSPSAPTYSAPNTTFHIGWLSPNATGPATQPSSIEVHDRHLGSAAFRNVGLAAGEIPSVSDLADSAFIAQSSLNVGFLGGQTRNEINNAAARGRLNFNGGMDVWQRGVSFTGSSTPNNNDGNLTADGWVIVSDGNDRVDVTRSTDAPTGFRHSMRLESVGSQNYGIMFCIPPEDAIDLAAAGASRKISVSFYGKFDTGATGIDSVRGYLLNQKVDAPGDPILAWPGAIDTDFTVNSTDWEIIASRNFPLTGDWTRFVTLDFEDVDPDLTASGNGGLAFLIHVNEASISAGSAWFLTGLQFNEGEEINDFIRWPLALEYAHAMRMCQTLADDGDAIGDGAAVADALSAIASGTLVVADWRFPVAMRKTPTFVPYGIAGGTAAQWYNGTASIAATFANINTRHVEIRGSGATDATIYSIAGYVHANVYGNS